VPDAVPILPAQSAGMLTLDYRFTPPPPPPSPLVFKTTTTLALPGPLLTTSGSAKYGDIHTGNVTDTSTLSAEVRGSISPGENSLLDQSGARAAAERGGQVRALARAAGQPTTVAVDPTLTASSTATQISQWLVTSDALAPGTLVPVDVLLHVGGTLQASGGDLAGEVSAFVKERLSLFREGAPVELLHEGGGTLDAAAGLVESGGWTFATVPGSPPAAVIDDVIVLQDLFTARVGEIFALELFLQTDAFAKDLNDRFALADFFQDGRGVSFELASDAAAQFALRVPGPAGAFLILPGLALALTLRRHLRRARAPSSGGA
jgi:hypothetical protein